MSNLVDLQEFSVAGIEVRTNNSREASGNGAIQRQWERFFREASAASIPNKADHEVIVVYSNYQSDHNGDYDYLIGAKVATATSLPPHAVLKKVSAGKYRLFTTPPGPVYKVVPETWQKILDLEDKGGIGRDPDLRVRFRNLQLQ